MSDMIACSECGNLMLVKGDDKYQRPSCNNCKFKNILKKVLDSSGGSGTITPVSHIITRSE